MPPLDFSLLLNPGHWFDGNPGSASAWYWIPAVIFLAATIAGFYGYSYLRTNRFATHALHARMAEVSGIAAISFGLWGLFLLLMRFLGVGLLSTRIVLYLTLLAGVGMVGYAIYWYSRHYAGRLRAQQREEERKRYLPTPKAGRPKPKPATANGSAKKGAVERAGGKPAGPASKDKPNPKASARPQAPAAGNPAAGKK